MNMPKNTYSVYAIATIEFSGEVFADSQDEATEIFENCAETYAQHDTDAQVYNVHIRVVEKN